MSSEHCEKLFICSFIQKKYGPIQNAKLKTATSNRE